MDGFDQRMNVVGHHHPSEETIINSVSVKQNVLYDLGAFRSLEHACSMAGVEIVVETLTALSLFFRAALVELIQNLGRQTVCQSECDMLEKLRDVKVGQVTAGMPWPGGEGFALQWW